MMSAPNKNAQRIAIIPLTTQIGGGAEKVATWLATSLSVSGHQIYLAPCYDVPDKHPYKGTYQPFFSKMPGRFGKLFQLPVLVWRIAQFAKRNHIDTVVAFLEAPNFAAILARVLVPRLRVVVSVRNTPRNMAAPIRFMMRLLYPYAECVVAVTHAVEQMLVREYGLTNTVTVQNPIDIEYVARESAKPLPGAYAWLTARSPLLISNGRYTHQKGQWHLIRAFTEVVRMHPDAALAIIGEGELRKSLERLIADCNLTEHAYLVGRHDNIYPFLAAADLFVFSSLYEGMPNALLEALAAGLTIVTPDCESGPREILAPDLGIATSITYPRSLPTGILTQALNPIPIWSSPAEVPLDVAEQQLAAAMLTALRHVGRTTASYAERFAPARVFERWEALILGTD